MTITRKSKHEYQVNFIKVVNRSYTKTELKEVIAWCHKNYGDSGRNKRCKWRFGWVGKKEDSFYFRNESDALFFVMRWQ